VAELLIRPRPSVRLLARELVLLGWCAVSMVGAVVVLVVYDAPAARLAMVLGVLWSGYAALTWGRALRRKLRILRVGAPSLHLDELGVRVRYPFSLHDASGLAWTDCAAVVLSDVPVRAAGIRRYVQFVAVADDRIEGRPHPRDPRPDQLGLTPAAARLAWLELAGQQPDADDVVAWLRTHRPGLRLVGTGAAAPA
jgi:hypothetical protein